MSTGNPVVCRVITWLPVGGIERRLVAVVPRLRDLGWRMNVVCIREEGPLAAELKDAGIPVTVIPQRSRLSPSGIRRLSNHFRSIGTEVVHSHMYRSNIPSTVAARMAGVPVILGQVHNVDSWDSGRQRFVDRIVSRFRTRTLAVSEAVRRDVRSALSLPDDRVSLLYNGVDTGEFRPDPSLRQVVRAEWGVSDDQLLFVVPARLHPQKNPIGVLHAFARVRAAHPTVRLAFVGAGKLDAELGQAVGEAGLGGAVILAGRRDDMPAVYNAADAIVLSSLKEGFSNAVVEALACGKPVIASDVGGNREAVDRPGIGWIHPAGAADMLVAQMSEATQRGIIGLTAMGEACRARALDFSIDALVQNTHQLYGSLLGRFPS